MGPGRRLPATWWFVDFSKPRGAMLVDGAELTGFIQAHNHDMLCAEVAQKLSGKATQMRDVIAKMHARRDRAVVFDLTGAYVAAF